MKKVLFFLCLLLSLPLYAQYSPADYDLVQTTFARKFDRGIMENYLSSPIAERVKAGLLSISNSTDTTFIPSILKLDYSKYGNYISFALGQLGPSDLSLPFLLDKIDSKEENRFRESAFEALGKTAGKSTLDLLIEKYFREGNKNFNGLTLAIANFNSRGIKSTTGKETEVLRQELTDKKLPLKRRINAVYALSRSGFPVTMENDLLSLLSEKENHEDAVILKQYTLSALRKLKTFSGSSLLADSLIKNTDWRIRTEAARVLCYKKYNSRDELDSYLQLLEDRNPNVSRQAAISVKEVVPDSGLLGYLKDEIRTRILHSAYTANTLGELLISYAKINPGNIFELINETKGRVRNIFLFRAIAEDHSSPEKNLAFLLENASAKDKNERLELLGGLLELQKYFPDDQRLDSLLMLNLSSDFAAAVSVTADGLDSLFIIRHAPELKKIVKRQTALYLDNPYFMESNFSLANLAKKIGPQFRLEVLNSMKMSALHSVSSFAFRELGKNYPRKDDLLNFGNFWNNAFKYKSARITTDKGSFTIKFSPEMAPVSVGSFCYLALKGFYNNIIFHRVVPDFVIQAGDPDGTGWGGPDYEIITEASPVPFDGAYVGMASAGRDTEGSQWFVMHSNFPHLNGRYSNFGKVIEGMNVVSRVDQGDKILKIDLK
ncbi:MAG: peptidylprolyl isomerase [Ignavibacteriales bacterium]